MLGRFLSSEIPPMHLGRMFLPGVTALFAPVPAAARPAPTAKCVNVRTGPARPAPRLRQP